MYCKDVYYFEINKQFLELMKLSLTLCMLGNFVCVFVTLVVFLKDFFKKLNMKKKKQQT